MVVITGAWIQYYRRPATCIFTKSWGTIEPEELKKSMNRWTLFSTRKIKNRLYEKTNRHFVNRMLLYRNQSKVDDTVNNATINADGTKNSVNYQVTKEILMKEAGISFGDTRFSYLSCFIIGTVLFTPFP